MRAKTKRRGTGDYRFRLYSFSEIINMAPGEWERECRLDGADMGEHPEDAVVRELVAAAGVRT